MNEAEIKAFASKHAPDLAQEITRLCGAVIAKGLTGILQQCIEMQEQTDALKNEVAELNGKVHCGDVVIRSLQTERDKLRATIKKDQTDLLELWKALNDLSFECDGVTRVCAPTRATYNRTFEVMERHRNADVLRRTAKEKP